MDAIELAKDIEDYLEEIEEMPWGTTEVLLTEAAAMLRKQEARLDEMAGELMSFENQARFESGYGFN
jgi:hypothetical protein